MSVRFESVGSFVSSEARFQSGVTYREALFKHPPHLHFDRFEGFK